MTQPRGRRWGVALVVALGIAAMAAEEIDTEIIKKFEFYSQLDVIENLDLAQDLGADESPDFPADTPAPKAPEVKP